MEESILTSIKLLLGVTEEYTPYDPQIIMHINSVFMILNQLGVGPENPFMISDKDAVWSDFIPDGDVEAVKSYVFMKVKLLFDPPTNGIVLGSYEKIIQEFEWRCNVKAEGET